MHAEAEVESRGDTTRIWCAQRYHTDTRVFLTAELSEFYRWYAELAPDLRNLYEVIRKDRPCRLYLDVEYSKTLNPKLEEARVVSTLKSVVVRAVKVLLGVPAFDVNNIVDLCATTPEKMSHHLILHIPGHVFACNLVCGQFVRSLEASLRRFVFEGDESNAVVANQYSRELITELFPQSSSGPLFVCDLLVYTNNRQFRVLGSAKRHRMNHFSVAATNTFPLPPDPEVFFEMTLAASTTLGIKVLGMTDVPGAEQQATLPRTVSPRPRPADPPLDTGREKHGPHIELDDFVLLAVREASPRATLGKIQATESGKSIKYDVEGTRWCRNIGREHKSNRVFFVANLARRELTQRCYDGADCPSFVSRPWVIPGRLCDNLESFFNDSDVSDDVLCTLCDDNDCYFNDSDISDNMLSEAAL